MKIYVTKKEDDRKVVGYYSGEGASMSLILPNRDDPVNTIIKPNGHCIRGALLFRDFANYPEEYKLIYEGDTVTLTF